MPHISQAIRDKADRFAHRFHGETDEDGEAKTFMDALFDVFKLDRYALARFEYPTRRYSSGKKGRADLFWRGKLLIEAKSGHLDKEQNWENTLAQALDYVRGLKPNIRPEFVLLTNFKRMKLYRLADAPNEVRLLPQLQCDLPLLEFADNLHHFAFFLEAQKELEEQEIRVNQEAAQRIATVHDSLELHRYSTENAAIFLSQILFCLFAEDTNIFEPLLFTNYVDAYRQQPQELGEALVALFDVLNTPNKERKNTSPQLAKFPYVNGSLFQTALPQAPPTTAGVFQALYEACLYDWSGISPEIFGSLFQAVMNPNERRSLGAHYTSENNILKLLQPLFLHQLKTEWQSSKGDHKKLLRFRQKINQLRFLDPACGCGNFLVVTYRELRLLDMQVIAQLQGNQQVLNTAYLSNIPLHHFYGYELDPTSARIATIAMWLTEHQLNTKFLDMFGTATPSIPLDDAANIHCTNALQTNWAKNIDYIIGNPPFVGKHLQNAEQKNDMERICVDINAAGVLDYVTCWYLKAAQYLQTSPATRVAFVSTNSIAQGEQTGVLWGELFNKYGIKIQFAHQTFKWSNEAKGIAAVHCVIVGFGKDNPSEKYLYEYPDISGQAQEKLVKNISPYLIEGGNTIIRSRLQPICDVQKMVFGSKPVDNGQFLFTTEEKQQFLAIEPRAAKWFKQIMGSEEFINGKTRWCLWLENIEPKELRDLPEVYKRVDNVRKFRLASKKAATVKGAAIPHMFDEPRHIEANSLIIPSVSSEKRHYIPFGYLNKDVVVSNAALFVPNATLYLFGMLTSKMHMAWVKYICGRLKSDYRYSNTIVYNNYPFPKEVQEKKRLAVATAAQSVLDIRAAEQAKGNTLADLYDPLTMPAALLKAHEALDKAVDKCYRDAPFATEAKRIEFLFDLYEQYTAGLFAAPKKKRKKA
ncbi:MAG: class I SAM-dependent DNA methyltransferase [Chitinophagales bacterium]|nr:class I SAM-dependent DNA methyltransferase [Chitinophagales bacterium]